jgi:para-nitrobenzyl esterase
LTDEGLKARLDQALGTEAHLVFTTYRKTRPAASAADLYTVITTGCMLWFPSIGIAERKYAQHGAPVYMYLFTHQSNFMISGTNHTIGATHAVEIQYKFNNIYPVGEKSHGDAQLPFSNGKN